MAMGGRLLVVDDQIAQVTALVRTLEMEGYAPTGAYSAAEALAALRKEHFDILITDLMMPEMDGVSLLRAAHALDPDLVGIVMTGHGSVDTAVAAMKSGALDYILKPFNLTAMLPVLSRAATVRRLRLENTALSQRIAERNAELEAANRELAAANRELEAFTSSVSHDLRQPLSGLMWLAESLMDDKQGPLNAQQKNTIGKILAGGRALFQLTNDLLRFARLGRLPLATERVDVSQLVDSVLADLHSKENAAAVEVRVGALPSVCADPSLLKQVFANLLANAFKFRRTGGQAVVEVSGWQDAAGCSYRVRDNGVGFDMQKAAKLFGLFQRLPGAEQFEGSGVGLSIAQRIVERHGGRIHAEARPGEGAQFTFTLPV
jgi:signal transduction histidine kinase